MPNETIGKFKRLTNYLTDLFELQSIYKDIYVDVRSFYLVKTLQALSQVAPKKRNTYEKGTHPFMTYTDILLRMLKAERGIVSELIPLLYADEIFIRTAKPALQGYQQAGEAVLAKKKGLSYSSEFVELLSLLDVAGFLSAKFIDYEDTLLVP
jgi:hypothetical protein